MKDLEQAAIKAAGDWAYEHADEYFGCSSLSCGGSGPERAAHNAFLAGAKWREENPLDTSSDFTRCIYREENPKPADADLEEIRPIGAELQAIGNDLFQEWKNKLRSEGAISERERIRAKLREVQGLLQDTSSECDQTWHDMPLRDRALAILDELLGDK